MKSLNRRQFLSISAVTAALTGLAACRSLSKESIETLIPTPEDNPFAPEAQPLPTLSLPDVEEQVAPEGDWLIQQSLRRITYGPTAEELSHARQIGIGAFIAEQLAPEAIEEDPHLAPILAEFETLTAEPHDLVDLDPRNQPAIELATAAGNRAAYSRRQLYEIMVDFWTNHFNIFIGTPPELFLKPSDDRLVIRPHALGTFPELLKASAMSPAMLTYLDNAFSNQEDPNENYARELLELHTLGVDGGYTQKDVEETARVFTGWSVTSFRTSDQPGKFQFRPIWHDDGEKTVLGHHFPSGVGQNEGEQLLEILAMHPSTARHLSFKLCRRFVADDPPEALVEQAAETYLATHGDIRAVLETILLSEAFSKSLGLKYKRPFEFAVSAMRVTGAQTVINRRTGFLINQMGQPIFFWTTPDGFPDTANDWISTTGMMTRWNFSLALALGGLGDRPINWAAITDEAAEPGLIVERLADRLIHEPLSQEALQLFVDFAEQAPPEFRTPATAAMMLASPYFQYR
jgi:uncharacterized protein (DUF1800 family)